MLIRIISRYWYLPIINWQIKQLPETPHKILYLAKYFCYLYRINFFQSQVVLTLVFFCFILILQSIKIWSKIQVSGFCVAMQVFQKKYWFNCFLINLMWFMAIILHLYDDDSLMMISLVQNVSNSVSASSLTERHLTERYILSSLLNQCLYTYYSNIIFFIT